MIICYAKSIPVIYGILPGRLPFSLRSFFFFVVLRETVNHLLLTS